jgi:hypothetical protein
MSGGGRKRTASVAQCVEVRRLAADGTPVRGIAEVVFGDRRFRGRVERILRAPALKPPTHDQEKAALDLAVSVEIVPTVRLALARYLVRIECGEIEPSVGEMVKLLDLERRLQVFESIELLNELSRSVDESGDTA